MVIEHLKDRVKVVCFDFDGTVVSNMAYLIRIATAVLKKHYGDSEKIAEKKYLETSGRPFEEQIEIMYPKNPRNIFAAADFEKQKLASYMSQKIEKDIHFVTNYLRRLGYKTAISSSTPLVMIDEYLIKNRLVFDLVLGFSDTFRKGSSHFNIIEDNFNVKRSAICFIGDSIYDYFVAKDNRVDFIAKAGTFDSKDFYSIDRHIHVIEGLKELTEIF